MAFKRWKSDERGATAVEFAIIGPLFLLVVMSCIEIGIELMTQLDLDNAAQAATRNIMIGGDTTQSAFVSDVCSHASVLLSNCTGAGQLQVNVTTASTFGALSPATINAAGNLSSTGYPGSITTNAAVLVQVAYKRPWDVAWLNTITGGASTLLSTVTTMSEPAQP